MSGALVILLATGIAGLGLTGAVARSAAPGPGALHLVIVPDTPRGEAALARSTARTVARYHSFTLVEASAADTDRLVAAGGDRRDDMRSVRIGSRTSDPTVARPSLLDKSGAAIRTTGQGPGGLAVVQYVGPIKDDWTAVVRKTGVHVVSYMAQNGQLVSGDDAALKRLAALLPSQSFIRAVTPYTASDKLRPGLARAGRTPVVVQTVAGPDGAAARSVVDRSSTRREDDIRVAGFVQQHVTVDAARIGGLAALAGVTAVEPDPEPKLLDERAAQIVAGNLNASFQPLLGSGYRSFLNTHGIPTGSAVTLDITDEGVDKGVVPAPAGSHPDFYRFGVPTNAHRMVYAHEATAGDTNARDCGGHGTNVAGIAAGYDDKTGATFEDAQGFNYGLGISPYSKIGATKVFNCAGSFDVTTSITGLHSAAYASGARVSNNSWGAAVGGAYNAQAQEFDSLVRDAQPTVSGSQGLTEVVSAGNAGAGANTVGSPGTAKDVITVGAAEGVRPIGATDGCGVPDTGADSARDIIDFSSRGPTDDGRIKPDIVAPGTHISGPQPQTGADYNGSGTCNPQFPAGSSLYTLVSGTSQAAPEVTGLAGLLNDWYKAGLGHGALPSPAMTKAIMVNTATDLAGGSDGAGGTNARVPTPTQGWGRVNLGRVLNGTARQAVDQTKIIGSTGTTHATYYNVAANGDPLRVTLAWTDPPGPTTGNSFVNDLDLVVTAGGQTYKGNVLSNGTSIAGGTADPRNNLENVILPAGVSGTIKVQVVGRNIVGDGIPGNADPSDQDYALLVSNVGAPHTTAPVLTDEGHATTVGGDSDGTLEPGEPFTIAQRLRNAGNATATGISGTATIAAGDGSVTQAHSTWPNLATGATGTGSPAFGATASPSLVCGDQVQLTITTTSNAGTLKVPVTLTTGHAPSSTQTHNATDVPKAIPDDAVAGVTSKLVVGSPGFITNMTVTVGQITHTFDSDLSIDIKSPAGTTVRLFNRNGGSGDNLTNTVFSDSAATPISSGTAPFTGSFRPFEPLSAFRGENRAGTWKLKVIDQAAEDTGTLSSWRAGTRVLTCS